MLTGRLRFHARWGWRLLARSPREQVLIISVLAVVALALTFVAALLWYGTRPPVAAIGPRAHEFILADSDKQSLDAGLRAAREASLNPVVVLEETVRFPGAASEIALRDQPLQGVLGGKPFSVLEGRYPHGRHEMAVTSVALEALKKLVGPRTALGTKLEVTAGPPLKIVGVVRDPRDHQSAAMFVDRSVTLAPGSASVYTLAARERLLAFQADNPSVLSLVPLSERATDGTISLSLMLALGALLIAELLAAVTYALSARRRLREYGMLAALGATSRQITATITAVGVVTSVVATIGGAIVGYGLVNFGVTWLEALLARDLPAGPVPPWIVVPPMLMIVCVSTIAARLPARAVARIPVVDALAARKPARAYSRRAVRFVPLAGFLAALAFAAGAANGAPLLLFSAPLFTFIALLLLAPLLVHLVGRASSWGPTAWRFAVRDISRKSASSVALLAGLTAMLTVPASIAILTASAERQRAAKPPNLPSNMLLVEESVGGLGGFSAAKPDHRGAQALLRRLRARLPRARTSAIQAPIAARTPVNRSEYGPRHPVVENVWAVQRPQRPPRVTNDASVWIATPGLLAAVIPDRSRQKRIAEVLSDNPEKVAFREPRGSPVGEHRPGPLGTEASEQLAGVWAAPRFAQRRGWRPHTAGWILVNDRPIPAGVIRAAAADAHPGFEVVGYDGSSAPPFPARLVLLAGCFAALMLAAAILALERFELERDARLYSAIGARRSLLRFTAATRTAVLTAVASLCAIVVGYSVWLANRLFSAEEPPLAVPIDLLLVAVALPVALGIMSAFAPTSRVRS